MKYPDWQSFTPETASAQLKEFLVSANEAVEAIEREKPATFADYVWRLDDATRELYHTWGKTAHLLGVMNSEAWRKVEKDFQGPIVQFSLRVSQSKALYEIAKAIQTHAELKPLEKRIIDKLVEGAEMSGVGLEGERQARFNAIQMELAALSADFHNAVIDATTPEIADAKYTETMKHSADRALRESVYRKRIARAPENAERINKILSLREEAAKILGFANYAEQSIAVKCAPSVKAVFVMIDELDKATKTIAEEEDRALEEASGMNLEPWDSAYYAERLRERKYSYSEDELKRYFELEEVLAGLFRIVKLLFGVEVREVNEKPSVWHEDVRFFDILEEGERIASFYFDPYVRTGLKSGGAWMNELINRNDRLGFKPLVVVATNFNLPDENGRTLLPFREVETLFHEFGHALQCALTRIGEEDAAGINLVEWDAVEVASQFMENWCLDDRTGIKVPEELKAKVKAAKNFRAASACRRQLAFAKLDLELHSRPAVSVEANALKEEMFRHFGMPFVTDDRFLCAFTHIFSGGYGAGYYGYKWAEVMSADCYGAFEEAGLNDTAAMEKLGRRYRESILALGGSKSALEVFRIFRGRDPEIAALIRQCFG